MDTLTVFNAALSFRLSWEGKFRSLEEHAAASLESPHVMNGNINAVVGKLRADSQMRLLFDGAYGAEPDSRNLVDALAAYESTLLTPNSRFDHWLMGRKTALTSEERGYRRFKELGCVSCHQGVNVGGNLFQRPGIFRPLTSSTPELLRVPSLRNVAITAPYFTMAAHPRWPTPCAGWARHSSMRPSPISRSTASSPFLAA
jgi:cytochrome c peroxidase